MPSKKKNSGNGRIEVKHSMVKVLCPCRTLFNLSEKERYSLEGLGEVLAKCPACFRQIYIHTKEK